MDPITRASNTLTSPTPPNIKEGANPNISTNQAHNTRVTIRRIREGPYLVMDGRADYTTFGKGWNIIHRFEHSSTGTQGPEEV